MQKNVGNTASAPLQTVDYSYNIRGWLTKINDVDNIGNDLFGFNIRYTNPTAGTALYNGNISQTLWRTANIDSSLKNYVYSYDALNRITGAVHNTGNYDLTAISYDKNGNILNLSRQGHINEEANIFGLMDNLVYTYDSGNKLLRVEDLANDTYGFKDDAVAVADNSDDYSYDANGNMISDTNKGITGISYNHLNLPEQVTINGENILYIYDASGIKQQKVAGGTTTQYAGTYIYENSSLKFANHAEGYIEPDGGGGYGYVYQYKDIWHNTRVTYTDDDDNGTIDGTSEICREQNFYPFGLEHRGYNSVLNGIKNNLKTYQDQEFVEDLGLNTHEWKYRVSDPTTGRFWQIDPLAEDYTYNSTYAFQENKMGMGVELEGLENVRFETAIRWRNAEAMSKTNGKSVSENFRNLQKAEQKAARESAGVLAEVGAGFIPGVGQAIDIKDAHDAFNGGSTVDKVFAVVAFIPGGDFLKAGKKVFKTATDVKWKGFSKGKLNSHFEKHGKEFGDITQSEYLKSAKDFAQETGETIQEQVVGNLVVKYDSATGRVLVGNGKNREIRTFYKADGRSDTPFEDAVKLAEELSNNN